MFDFISLHQGEEKRESVLENIKQSISFRGSNLWILACAIVIASVGLNVNSTAVVIGAMLISPLMGPIVGAGFALAVFDFELLKRCGKNLLIATIVSLVVSAIYFFISPFKDAQPELLARTSPTIYDVLIAFFGGLVGVIALTRVEKGNPIPGVAIATALMPPLCTAGYGLAMGNFSYFFGAFYLYSINCFFICIATYFIVRYLKYTPVQFKNIRFEKQIRYGISFLLVLMIVPSFYLAYNLLKEKQFHDNVSKFIENEFTSNGYPIIFKEIKYNTSPKKIELAFLSKRFSNEEEKQLNHRLNQYQIFNTSLIIKQGTQDLKKEILNELGTQNKALSEKDIIINNLQNEIKEFKFDDTETYKEIGILFPEAKNVSIGKFLLFPNSDSAKIETVVLFHHQEKEEIDTLKLKKWLIQKLSTNNIKLVELDKN
ncbi:TIGR00341 family protein [Amniculibacterium sp. G2-70]|uniref:TIGR00341 family protein n=1 Tax=Amniculibacterium sp. G2-70 TaxID=2767188 RepID=UPI0039747F49